MIKMQIKMDEAKIERERRFAVEQINATLDGYLIDQLHLKKGEDGFYWGTGSPDDFGNFGLAMVTLGKKPWFMDNVDTWLYFNSEDGNDSEDYVVEDFKEFCRHRYQIAV